MPSGKDGITRQYVRATARLLAEDAAKLNAKWYQRVYETAAKAITEDGKKKTKASAMLGEKDDSFRCTALSVFPRLALEPLKLAMEADKMDARDREREAIKGSGIVQTEIVLTPGEVTDDEQRI